MAWDLPDDVSLRDIEEHFGDGPQEEYEPEPSEDELEERRRENMQNQLELFTDAYITAALWSSIDDDGTPLDREHDVSDISSETLAQMRKDCAEFYTKHQRWFSSTHCFRPNPVEQAGHDFWLTRNGHAGFWDGDWSDEADKTLTKASKSYGEVNLYVGDDGKIYSI